MSRSIATILTLIAVSLALFHVNTILGIVVFLVLCGGAIALND